MNVDICMLKCNFVVRYLFLQISLLCSSNLRKHPSTVPVWGVVLLSVLLSLIVYMKIQMSAFDPVLFVFTNAYQVFFTWNFKCGSLLRHENFGLVCFILNVMSFCEKLSIKLHTRWKKLKLSYLPGVQPQSCATQHTNFPADPSVSPSVSWKCRHQPALGGGSWQPQSGPAPPLSWSYETFRKCSSWGMSSFKLGDELSADVKQRSHLLGVFGWMCQEGQLYENRGGVMNAM